MSDHDDHPNSKTFSLKEMQDWLISWIKDHPCQTTFLVVGGVVIIAPGVVTGPFLASLGLSVGGPIPATAFPAIMSWLGTIGPGSPLAIAQGAAMGGKGAAVLASAVQAGAFTSSAAIIAYNMRMQKRREGPKL